MPGICTASGSMNMPDDREAELEQDLNGAVIPTVWCLCCPQTAVRYLHSVHRAMHGQGQPLSCAPRCSVQARKHTVKAETVLNSPHTCLCHPPKQHILIAFILFFTFCCSQQVLGKTQCSPSRHGIMTELNGLWVHCFSCRLSGRLCFLNKLHCRKVEIFISPFQGLSDELKI